MNTFKKWNHKTIEDDGCYMSSEAKSFYRGFKNFLKRSFPDAELVGFKPNHYDTSGFIIKDNKCIYVSHSINRGLPLDFNANNPMTGVLYRKAKCTTDYTGGTNNFSSMFKLADNIQNMLDRYDIVS